MVSALRDEPVKSDGARVLAFCGHCHHFEVGSFGDGGECHKGHHPLSQTNTGHCPDRTDQAHSGSGPRFDMSE